MTQTTPQPQNSKEEKTWTDEQIDKMIERFESDITTCQGCIFALQGMKITNLVKAQKQKGAGK